MGCADDQVPGGAGGGEKQAGEVGANTTETAKSAADTAANSAANTAASEEANSAATSVTIDRALLERVKADYVAGERVAEIAARHGVTRHLIYKRAERQGWGALRRAAMIRPGRVRVEAGAGAEPARRCVKHPVHLSRAQWQTVLARYDAGETARDLAVDYDISPQTVYARLAARGRRETVDAPSRAALRRHLVEAADADREAQRAPAPAWETIARPAQLPPQGAWSTWLFQGGRGAGKTRAGAEWLAGLAEGSPGGRFALVGATQADVREVMSEGVSGLRNLPGRERPRYESARRRLVWRNGAMAYAYSAEEPERLRGPQFIAAWADEFCTWPKPDETLSILRMALRLGETPQLAVTTTPKPMAALRRLRAEAGCVTTHAATAENAGHLPRGFLDGLAALYGGTRLERQELEGVLLDSEGALWRAEELAAARGVRPQMLEHVVVGVDPPASNGGVCGIVVAGRAGHMAHVLADRSGHGLTPLGWAQRVVAAAHEFGAREIVAEVNQGGDMVRSVLVSAGADCAVRTVRASVSKRARAEPVAALYEQGRVAHCGVFTQLEEELMAMGGEDEAKLDRADALVWAITALLVEAQPPPRITVL